MLLVEWQTLAFLCYCTFHKRLTGIILATQEYSNLNSTLQGAKKIIFKACHSGKLELAFTSPDIIWTSPKAFWRAELISQFFCYSNSSKNITCPSGKLKTEFTSPIAKSTSPRLSETTFFARWHWHFCHILVQGKFKDLYITLNQIQLLVFQRCM